MKAAFLIAMIGCFFGQAESPPRLKKAELKTGNTQTADDKKNNADSAKARSAVAGRIAKLEASRFDFYLGTDRKARFTLHPEPIQRFTNPVVGEFYASVFIWTHKGRPEVIASIVNWYSPTRRLGAELQSLSLNKVTATRDGKEVWHPEKAGVVLKPIPGASVPADTAAKRLRQMRTLVREFTAQAMGVDLLADVDKQLRLLSRPIYRYQSTDPKVLDGALFAFVRGTDPELLLLIEARRTKRRHTWQFALARMNSLQFRVLHKDHEVWSVPQIAPPWTNVQDRKKIYTIFSFLKVGDEIPTELER